jgi:hypothetical protein
MDKSRHAHPDRRNVIIAGGALIGASVLPNVAGAAEPDLGSAAELLAAVRKFQAGLEPDKLKAASFAWNAPQWLDWNYFGFGNLIKPGLRLEQMSASQKEAAWSAAATVWSPAGIKKAQTVMLLQDVLKAQGDNPENRNSQRFSFAIFGAPAETGTWGFRIEGHHLHQSVSVRDGRIVSVTPSSFSSNPNRIASGSHAGLVTLQEEERLARRLFGDLPPQIARKARQSDRPLNNILSFAGRERANAKKVGVPAAELASAQRDLIWQLVETYSVAHLPSAVAEAQKARVRGGDRDAVHFAWYGPNTPEKAFGYRVIGDGFVIEMGSVDPDALHLHTIYHDLANVLGRTA